METNYRFESLCKVAGVAARYNMGITSSIKRWTKADADKVRGLIDANGGRAVAVDVVVFIRKGETMEAVYYTGPVRRVIEF